MTSKQQRKRDKKIIRQLRKARRDAQEVDAQLRATAWECATVAEDCRLAYEHLAGVHARLGEVLGSISSAAGTLQAADAALEATTRGTDAIALATDVQRRLEQMLVAQRRTNELLDLALGVAFDTGIEAAPPPR
jgi:hypothetical protein